MKFIDKLKITKKAAEMSMGGVTKKVEELTGKKVKEIQAKEEAFKEKELALLAKFEDLLEENFKEIKSNQRIILGRLNEIKTELK